MSPFTAQVIVPKSRHFAVVIIPKCASTAVKFKLWAAEKYYGQQKDFIYPLPDPQETWLINDPRLANSRSVCAPFLNYDEARRLAFEGVLPVFVVGRDPEKRLRSVYLEKIRGQGRRLSYKDRTHMIIDEHYINFQNLTKAPNQDLSFAAFLDYLLADESTVYGDPHWSPFSAVIGTDGQTLLKRGDWQLADASHLNRFMAQLVQQFYQVSSPDHLISESWSDGHSPARQESKKQESNQQLESLEIPAHIKSIFLQYYQIDIDFIS